MDDAGLKTEEQGSVAASAKPAAAAPKKHHHRTVFSRYHFRPYRDWRVVLVVTALILAGTIYYGYDLFSKVRAGDAFTIQQTKTRPAVGIDTKKIQEEVDYYRARARSYGSYKNAAPVVVDPSI
jgi:cytochrome c-type biogenesis protein CcmH/NrfG